MRTRLWVSLGATILIVLSAFVGNLAVGNLPLLGLDLQGGASVILEPADDASGADLTVVRDLIRDELERTGIAEPNVRVQGETIVVELPGVKDQQEALAAVDVSGIVELRPVVGLDPTFCAPADGALDLGDLGIDEPTPVDEPVTTDATVTSDTLVVTSEPVPADTVGARGFRSVPETSAPSDSVPSDSVPADSVPPEAPAPEDVVVPNVPQFPAAGQQGDLLFTREGQPLCLGPVQGTGEVFERQSALIDNQLGFSVNVGLRSGPDGEGVWNNLASQCFNGLPTCPSLSNQGGGQLAIVLDGVIVSAPTVNAPSFSDTVSITGRFTQDEAEDLANILNRGAFPVEMVAQDSETISPAAGQESLRASIIAGLLGVALVLTFLIAYYRWIALVILSGLTIWGLTVFSVASFVSAATNYSLSLAGVTGIIVAVGVTVDSYVVFFERMKDEIRNGRTLKNAAPRSFKMTWRTIWSADLVSVIGAAILFWLSVGSVRGFALFLGITTLCDLVVCYFFTRPAVLLLARSKFMVGKRAFGLEVAS
jgi:preprotein translocase subunit SecD